MGCGSSNTTAAVGPDPKEEPSEKVDQKIVYPPAEAFDVPLDDSEQSIIKKHPPKRLLDRLLDAQNTVPTTIEDLEEKLTNADIRRKQFLQQRVERIKDADETESTGVDAHSGGDPAVLLSHENSNELIDDAFKGKRDEGVVRTNESSDGVMLVP